MDFVATSADPARPLPSISLDPPPRRAVIPPDPFPPTLGAARARIAAVRPSEYARTRNAIDGAVTRLSPYLTHGFVSLPEVLAGVAARHRVEPQHKLVYELGWREWFRHVWTHEGDGLLESLHEGPLPDRAYARALPDDVRRARTGVPVVDQAVRTLYATGYLHNHARMRLASYLVHLRKVHWRAGADWMLGHLLDGDLASNHLSWQWVAGTGSRKPYLFNADNVARYATGPAFAGWQGRGTVIDQDYEALDRTARLDGDVGPERGEHAGIVEPLLWAAPLPAWVADSTKPLIAAALPKRREIELVTPWSLSEREGGSGAGAGGPWRLGLIHLPAHEAMPWSEARWRWVLRRMGQVTDAVFVGDVMKRPASTQGVPAWPGRDGVFAFRAPMPGYDAALGTLATLRPASRLLPNPETPCRSFSVFYEAVKRQSRSLQSQLNGELP